MKKYILFTLLVLAALMWNCNEEDFTVPAPSSLADFSYTGGDNYFPETIYFENKSINVLGYQWNFGNGETSEQENPTVIFENPGNYNVSLTIIPKDSTLHYNKLTKSTNIVVKSVPYRTLYFGDRNTTNIKYTLLNNEDPVIQSFNHTGVNKPYGLDIDTVEGKIYCIDFAESILFRYNLDGSGIEIVLDNTEPLFSKFPTTPKIIGEKIYWGAEEGIYRADKDGSNAETVVPLSLTKAPEMVIDFDYDPEGDHYYFTNDKYDYPTGGIWRADGDGSNVTQLVMGTDGMAFELDLVNQKMYYVDYNKGLCINNLSGNQEIVLDADVKGMGAYGLAIDHSTNKIYYSIKNDGIIRRSDLDGSNKEDFITIAGSEPYAIAIDKLR